MTDQDRFNTISQMFKKTLKPKLVIDKIGTVRRIIIALDGTEKSQACIELGLRFSQRWQTETTFLRIQRYGAHLLDYINTTRLAAERNLEEIKEKIGPDPVGFKAEIQHIAGVAPATAQEIIENALKESGGALALLIKEIDKFKPDLVIIPVPFAEEGETGEDVGEDSLGMALDVILRRTSRDIPILLVEGESVMSRRNIICVFNPEQHPESVKITLFHALKLADAGSDVTLLGIIDPSLAETFVEIIGEVEEEDFNISKVKDGLRLHMEHLIEGVQVRIKKKINLKRKIVWGSVSECLNTCIGQDDPGLIIYQSRFDPNDPLDNMADSIARHESRVPVLIVWE